MSSPTTSRVLDLGTGQLNWGRYERIGDRYGAVRLLDPEEPFSAAVEVARGYAGTRGTLRAEVRETRPSGHIGDLFRGFFPGGAEVGEDYLLGEGELFFEDDEYGPTVGLRPDDGRDVDWLDPRVLYVLHEQTVRLRFEEER